jgi:hypothetical protein
MSLTTSPPRFSTYSLTFFSSSTSWPTSVAACNGHLPTALALCLNRGIAFPYPLCVRAPRNPAIFPPRCYLKKWSFNSFPLAQVNISACWCVQFNFSQTWTNQISLCSPMLWSKDCLSSVLTSVNSPRRQFWQLMIIHAWNLLWTLKNHRSYNDTFYNSYKNLSMHIYTGHVFKWKMYISLLQLLQVVSPSSSSSDCVS